MSRTATPARAPATALPSTVARSDRRRGSGRLHVDTWVWFALPAILFVGVFFLLPLLLNVRFAFSNWTSYSSLITWNGLDNFKSLHEQGYLLQGIWVTAVYAVFAMLLQNVISLTLAYNLREPTLINGIFRTIFFIPVLMSPLAAGYIWRGLLAPTGPLNDFIGLFAPGFAWAWLGETTTALFAVAFIDAWKWIGLTTLVYIAGINSVSREVIESAVIDGANGWQRFWRITFPLLAPAFTFNTVVSLVGAFSAYDVIAATTNGGPGDSTRSLNILLRLQWGQGDFGTASALGFTVTLMVIVVAVPMVWLLRKREI